MILSLTGGKGNWDAWGQKAGRRRYPRGGEEGVGSRREETEREGKKEEKRGGVHRQGTALVVHAFIPLCPGTYNYKQELEAFYGWGPCRRHQQTRCSQPPSCSERMRREGNGERLSKSWQAGGEGCGAGSQGARSRVSMRRRIPSRYVHTTCHACTDPVFRTVSHQRK